MWASALEAVWELVAALCFYGKLYLHGLVEALRGGGASGGFIIIGQVDAIWC